MKALKAALEELNNQDPYADVMQSIAELEELATYAENNSGESAGVSMESIFKSFREPDYLDFGHAHKATVAMEELTAGIWAAIAAIAVAVIIALKKFYDWAFGGSSSSSSSSSGASSSEGKIQQTVVTLYHNKKLSERHRQLIKDLEDEFRNIDFETNAVANEDMSGGVSSLIAQRKQINSMEDVLALQVKDFTETDPAWQFFMTGRDAFSDDILKAGPYTKMTSDIVRLVQNGQFSNSRSKALQDELSKLIKAGNTTSPDEFDKFNEKLGDYDNIQTSGLGSSFKTVDELVIGARKTHDELSGKLINGRLGMVEAHRQLERQLEGATVSQMSKAVDDIKATVKDSEEHYNNFKIEADVNAHNEAKSTREGSTDAARHHRSVGTTMKHMSKYSKNLCELARILFVWSKGILKIMGHLRSASYTALKILHQAVLPRVKNEDSKKRITDLGKELKTVLAQYVL